MVSNLDPQNAFFINEIGRIEDRISQASNTVSSGLRINQASDAPDQIGTLLQLRANLSHNDQVQANLTLAQTDTQAADDTLSSSITMMDTATGLATQGATATATATTRLSLAQQVGSILQQMVANSQTSVEGRFIFSGDRDSTPQYTWDPAQANPVVAGQAAASTRLIEDPAGGTFAASLTAQQIFDNRDAAGNPANDNVFHALATLQAALQNNDPTQITNSITMLQAASVHLNTMQAFYGNLENQLRGAADYASQYATQLQTQISNLQDADITSAVTQLTQGNIQLQAAMQTEGQRPRNTLFSYLG